MNELYEAAKRRVAAIREEEAALNEFIRAHERARRLLGTPPQASLFGDGDILPVPKNPNDAPVFTPATDAVPMPKPRRTRVTDNPKPADVIDGAIAILRERGEPMSRRELHVALGERGLQVKGADPIKALGTMLWRGRDRLTQLERFGYWPIGDVFEPANYHGGL